MQQTTLIVPGYHGSGPLHWQTWMERQLPAARRVRGIDWEAPVLARWASAVRDEIDAAPHAVWLVAHSFGCLASMVAAVDRPHKVAGVLLVAPADPERFAALGLRELASPGAASIAGWIPQMPLECPAMVVVSSDDPWVGLDTASVWAERWGARLIRLDQAGHINVDSGFGPWPLGLQLLRTLQSTHNDLPLGAIDETPLAQRGRRGALARIRHHTRTLLHRLPGNEP